MNKYTTGEIAELCGVSVRTVQYYDTRGILVPSELSEGGRRIYSVDDLKKMRLICFLRDLGLPIDSIKQLFEEEKPEEVISLLLEEQERQVRGELSLLQTRADRIAELRSSLKNVKTVSPDSIADAAKIIQSRKYLRRLRIQMLMLGLLMDIIEVSTLVLWIVKGMWLPFAIGLIPVIALGILASYLYFCQVDFLCPECHSIFHPRIGESFFAYHTPNTRRLTCKKCGYRGFCVEIYRKQTS